MDKLTIKQKNLSEDYFFKKKEFVSFVLSIFVIMIHNHAISNYGFSRFNYYLDYFLTSSFTRVAVPLFFIISGFCFFRNYTQSKYISKLKKRVFTLVIPYLLWNTIWMAFNMIIAKTPLVKYYIGREIAVINISNIFMGIFHYKYTVNWFVFCLIIFTIIAPLFDSLSKNKLISMISLFCFYLVFNCDIVGGFLDCYICCVSIPYYFIGVIIAKYYKELFEDKYTDKQSIISFALFCILLLVRTYLDYNLINNSYFDNLLLAVSAILFWISIGFVYNHLNPRMVDIYKCSFIIYEMHLDIVSCIVKLLYLLLPKYSYFYFVNFVMSTVITVILILLIVNFMSKWLNPLYKLLSGNR